MVTVTKSRVVEAAQLQTAFRSVIERGANLPEVMGDLLQLLQSLVVDDDQADGESEDEFSDRVVRQCTATSEALIDVLAELGHAECVKSVIAEWASAQERHEAETRVPDEFDDRWALLGARLKAAQPERFGRIMAAARAGGALNVEAFCTAIQTEVADTRGAAHENGGAS